MKIGSLDASNLGAHFRRDIWHKAQLKATKEPLIDDREGFAREARRQSLAVANSPMADEDQAFIDSISDWSAELNTPDIGDLDWLSGL